MIVVTLTDCPISLRGDLTKWLLEINTGVFVGRVSARVRDNLWLRVKECVKNGRATMVYSTNNEQHMEFRLHNSNNLIVDFDGLKLVMKPDFNKSITTEVHKSGFSNAAIYRKAKKKRQLKARTCESAATDSKNLYDEKTKTYPAEYVVVDIETTGLREQIDEIIEVGMLHVVNGEIKEKYQTLIKPKKLIPKPIERLTGISNEMVSSGGKEWDEVMPIITEFLGKNALVGYNVGFDVKFLNKVFENAGHGKISNKTYDTMSMYMDYSGQISKRKSLAEVVEELRLEVKPSHRAIPDAISCQAVYETVRLGKKIK